MAAVVSLARMERRRPAQEDICPLESKSLRTDGENVVCRLDRKSPTLDRQEEGRTPVCGDITVTREHVGISKVWLNTAVDMATSEASEDELGRLDIDLDRKSKQHNLTSSNVRAILHEVITHEHVVAMMKAAIRDTQDLPMFEPKMTRSRLKQAIQQGQPLNWSLSAVNTAKPPQFVDIDLEEDEDSSDEEYCPEEEEEEEDTAEETFLSDADSLASPPKMHQDSQPKVSSDQRTDAPLQRPPGPLGDPLTCTPHHLLPPPESSFLERLNAVDEELDSSAAFTYHQSLDRKADDDGGGDEGSSCLAFRTRSKRPLVNVPLGQLEAELLAPDITADMYEQSAAQRKQDRHWTKWLQGLMAPDTDEEADDDDDPEYNFLEDVDEPDLEDYRTDRGVQITKKEVNELLEELFDTLQEEEEEHEEEEPSQTGHKFNVPQALRFDAPLASMLTERRRTVRKQYEAAQQRRALQDTTNHHRDDKETASPAPVPVTSVLVLPGRVEPALHLNSAQKLQLQQQIQQHVQLLTQVHLLSRRVDALNHEACISKHYLEELQQFSSRREQVFLPSSFRVCNLRGALDLLQEVEQRVEPSVTPLPVPAAASRRWLPTMTPATNSHAFPLLPADAAWLFATRPVFLYPELLPVCSLDPPAHSQRPRSIYTAGEDGLIVLALKHFAETLQPDQLISCYLLCKSRWNFKKHVRDMSGPRAPRNSVIKTFVTQRVVPVLPLACSRVDPGEQRPPVDRNIPNTPNWLKNSQLIIQKSRLSSGHYPPSLPPGVTLRLHPYWLSKSSHPPPPSHRRIFALAHNASLLPLAQRPADSQSDRQSDRPEGSLLDSQASRKSKRQTDRRLDRKINQPVDRQSDRQPINCLPLPPPGVTLLSDSPAVSTALTPPLAVSTALAPPLAVSTALTPPLAVSTALAPPLAVSTALTPPLAVSTALTPPLAVSTALTPPLAVSTALTPPLALSTALTPPLAVTTALTPPLAVSTALTPPLAVSTALAPPLAVSTALTPPLAVSTALTPPLAVSTALTPPLALSTALAPPLAVSTALTPPLAVTTALTPPLAVSTALTPPLAVSTALAPPLAVSTALTPPLAVSTALAPPLAVSTALTPPLAVSTALAPPLAVSTALAPPPVCGAVSLAAVHPGPAHILQPCLPIGQWTQQSSRASFPLPSLTDARTNVKPAYFLLQMVWTPASTSQHALGQQLHRPIKEEREDTTPCLPPEEERREEEESSGSTSTLSPMSSCEGEEEENWAGLGVLNRLQNTAGEEEEGREGGGEEGEGDTGSGEEEHGREGGEDEERREEEEGAAGGGGGGGGGGEGDEGREEEEGVAGGGEGDEGGEEEEGDGEKEKDEDQDRQGEEEEEEEEDFDDLTQDEDEEEVMSSASEESVLSVPELQETMKQLTWLAAERRLCADGDSEEDHSPTSQEEEEEEEEEGPKGEESGEGRGSKEGGDEETPAGEETPRGGAGGRCLGRGRGRSRPLRGLRKSRQERHSKDAAKLLLLYDENIVNNDPHRESKDVAFAQSYLNRVREALQDVPGQVEEFVSLLNDFEQLGGGQEVMSLFRKLRCVLGERTDLLRDFAAFLHPEQALQCGLFEEQQAFERSRRFLRQLEISFGDNPSHYQKIIKALQTGPDLSPNSITELKSQMSALLKGHTHLQTEFWVFFDELRPPPARPGQFEEAHWPEDGGGGSDGGEGGSLVLGGGASCGFEEVTLPELEEEEEGLKIQPMTSRRQRRKMDAHRNYKDCDWSDEAKISRHRRKGCSHCHGNKTSGGVSRAMKSLDPLYSQISSAHKDLDLKGDHSPQPDGSGASWEGSFPLMDEKEEEEEELDDEEDDEEEEQSPAVKRRREETSIPPSVSSIPPSVSSSSPSIPPSVSSISPSVSSSSPSIPPSVSSPSIPPSVSSSIPPSISSISPSVSSSSPSTPPSVSSPSIPPSVSSPSIPPSVSSPSLPPSVSSSPSITPSLSSSPSIPPSVSSIPPSVSSIPPSVSSIPPSVSSIPPSVSSSSIPPSVSSPSIPPSLPSSSSIPPSLSSSPSIPPSVSSIPPSVSSSIPPSLSSSPSIPPSLSSSPSIPLSVSSFPPSVSSFPPSVSSSSPPPDLPVCAKNISLTASGEKVILWTREADRVILTRCQQEGANQNTFQAVSTLLGNKTPSEVSRRFRDLMRLFRTAARQTGSEDEAPPPEPAAANEEED